MNLITKGLSVALGLLVTVSASVSAQRPAVMHPTLPAGTMVSFEPDYPVLEVEAAASGDIMVVHGQLDSGTEAIDANTEDWNLCRSQVAVCRKFDVRLPKGRALAGEIEYFVRKRGESQWTPLEALKTNQRFFGTYEEFPAFTASPYFASANCAVHVHEETAWEVRNWSGHTVDFQIRIHMRTCPTIVDSEEEAD